MKPDRRKSAINPLRLVLLFGWVKRKDGELVCGNWDSGTVSHTWPSWVSLDRQSWVLWTLVFTGTKGQVPLNNPQALLDSEPAQPSSYLLVDKGGLDTACLKLIIYGADTILQKGWGWVTDRPTCWDKAMLQLNHTTWLNPSISAHYAVKKKAGYLYKELVAVLPARSNLKTTVLS